MYAIIQAGGKQYRVQPGETIRVEKLDRSLGEKFEISDILCVGGEKTIFGEPFVKGASVSVVVTQQDRAKKILVFKKKRRKGYRRMQGHRQHFTDLFVQAISGPNGDEKAKTQPLIIDPAKKVERLEKLAAKAPAKEAGAKTTKKAKAPAKKAAAKKVAPKKKAASKSAQKRAGASKAKKAAKKK